jgi:predicted RNA-binding Zn-ribbon protein involved in translation (DUF1610 family)
MTGAQNAKVIIARCSKTQKTFGIRIEERGNGWVSTWAFPIDERKAKHEGYSDTSTVALSGQDDNFPGCPHCGDKNIVQFGGCKKIGCGGGSRKGLIFTEIICPWCGEKNVLQNGGSLNVSGGGY